MTAKHTVLGGKVYLYKRGNGRHWQCSTFLNDRNYRISTKEDSLSRAKEFAEDWYLELRGKLRLGYLKPDKTFEDAAALYLSEYEIITGGQRNAVYVEGNKRRLRKYLIPFFGKYNLSDVTSGLVQDYRVSRLTNSPTGKPPARSTSHQEIVTLRQVLKTAIRRGWLTHLPDLSMPYKTAEKITHRAWFSPEEYKQLYEATRRRAHRKQWPRYKRAAEELHDYILFMANTGLRPDEANRLEYRDVQIVDDDETNETILVIEVRGKRGVGIHKSTSGAVRPFERQVERSDPNPTDRVFSNNHTAMLNNTLEEENLKFDREGNRRTAYSLRHTYICMRLMEGADIYQVAKNCRTSVEMIEKYYASHIQTSISAAAVNVRKIRRRSHKTTVLTMRNAHRVEKSKRIPVSTPKTRLKKTKSVIKH